MADNSDSRTNPAGAAASSHEETTITATAAISSPAIASVASPNTPSTSAASATTTAAVAIPPVMQSCLSALGPSPIVDSSAALLSFSSQLHSLTAPLPSAFATQQLHGLEDIVQASLERLDEFSALVEALKYGSIQASSEVLPEIIERQRGLEEIFQRIHTFDKFAQAQEAQLSQIEARVASVETILRKTDAMEVEYAKNKPIVSYQASGVAASPAGSSSASSSMAKAEESAKRLFSSLMGRKNKPPAATSVASPASPSSSSAAPIVAGPSVLDLMDAWQPFDETMQPVDIDEWFAAQP